MRIFIPSHLFLFIAICGVCFGEEAKNGRFTTSQGCQSASLSGRDYRGSENTTEDGLPCQRWNESEPHEHAFTQEGDHNFCRNPIGAPAERVFCYTTDPSTRYQFCSVPFCSPLQVLDFSEDNDMKSDENQEYTHASLDIDLPPSFMICSAFTVNFWEGYNTALLYLVRDNEAEQVWLSVEMFAALAFTKFTLQLSDDKFTVKTSFLFYPLKWMRTCFTIDSKRSFARFVVGGEVLIEKSVNMKYRKSRNATVILGSNGDFVETTGKTTSLNIFSSTADAEEFTKAGTKECGAGGDLVNWEGSQWKLHSKARLLEVDGGLEGPCRPESEVQVLPLKEYHWQPRCMQLCEKLGGRSPAVLTIEDWTYIFNQIQRITPNAVKLPDYIWLSATEGDYQNNLARSVGHWPEGKKAEEGKWRDYYTGEELKNYTKPWFSINEDREEGNHSNCLMFSPIWSLKRSWKEWQCDALGSGLTFGCPCSFKNEPSLRFRGLCPGTNLEQMRYTPMQFPSNPSEILMVGSESTQISFDSSLKRWILRSPFRNVTALSQANQVSYALGTQNWTITGDSPECSLNGEPYTTELKLTACRLDEFTCATGKCINMEQRCNQLPDCPGWEKSSSPLSPALSLLSSSS